MARGIRSDTLQRIQMARVDHPLAMGPLFGELATSLNISAGLVATITKAHQQTVLRWFFAQTPMQPQWIKASLKLFGVLMWMHASKIDPLEGDSRARFVELTKHLRAFERMASDADRGSD